MILNHLVAISIALIIDFLIGDPPHWPHPVKWMGSFIHALEKRLNKGAMRKGKGILFLVVILLVVFLLSVTITKVSYLVHPIVGILVEAIMIATTIAGRSLKEASLEVYVPLKENDLNEARKKLSYIVGRDTEHLQESDIVRGTVETVAENTSDGVTAPLFWAFIGGAPLAMLYRVINTCDSMVGYKNEKYINFGWASARMDDVANWIPSRLTAFVMLLCNKPEQLPRSDAWKLLFRDAKKHPSPNSGWGEASVAALLSVQLGGVNYYKGVISNRPQIGDATITLKSRHILKVNEVLMRTTYLFFILLWIGGISIEMAFTWIKSSLFI